jgi:putative RecB family exonuclease
MPRSYSQLNQYDRCSWAYKLDRVDRAWNKPAFWLAMGTATHEACERWERSNRTATVAEAQQWYREAYVREANEYLDETPDASLFESSGPYAGPEDAERRYRVGQDHVRLYIKYYSDHPDQTIWTAPDGQPAIELAFEVEISGVMMRGFIDAVIVHPKHGLVIRDTKTGADPGTPEQLEVYRAAIKAQYGVEINAGDFFMTKTGKPKPFYTPHDLSSAGTGIHRKIQIMDESVKAGIFTPNPGDACARCSVRDACEFKLEPKAREEDDLSWWT